MQLREIIGSRLKEIREENKLSQSAIAKELGVSQASIAQYEMGKSCPNEDILLWYANKFDVSLDYIFGKTSFMNMNKTLESLTPGSKNYASLEKVVEEIVNKKMSKWNEIRKNGQQKIYNQIMEVIKWHKY